MDLLTRLRSGTPLGHERQTVEHPHAFAPGGRLSLTAQTPVTTSDVTGAGTLYYVPYLHNRVPGWDGAKLVMRKFAADYPDYSKVDYSDVQLALSLTSGKNYDVFIFWDGYAHRLCMSTAWTNDTTRADALAYRDGMLVNAVSGTNYVGCLPQQGLYLGTIRASGANTIDDSAAKRFVWNKYNQVRRHMKVVDATASWTYSTNTWRYANNSSANRIDFVLGENSVVTANVLVTVDVTNNQAAPGIGLDSSTANSADITSVSYANSASITVRDTPTALYRNFPGLGFHFLSWIEQAPSNSGTVTWYGTVTDYIYSGISGEVMA